LSFTSDSAARRAPLKKLLCDGGKEHVREHILLAPRQAVDLAGGLLRQISIRERVMPLLDEGVVVNPEGFGRVTLRVRIDQAHRIAFQGESGCEAD